MRIGKPKSKRTPVRLRHKIEKASAAKQRKNRKEAKKNPQWRSRIKKDPGIPNLFPYKAKLLAEMEEQKRLKQEEQQKKRQIAKAQRQGTTVEAVAASVAQDEDELLDEEDDVAEDDEMDVQDSSNPMAALLASAQARAQNYDEDDNDEEESDDEEDGELQGIKSHAPKRTAATKTSAVKVLPQKVIADPIPTVTALVERMQSTQDGFQKMLDFYQIPPLVTSNSDTTSRYLVEVARKTGRLGRGGVPNLHSAALTVLSDLYEDRLQLPSVTVSVPPKKQDGIAKGTVQVVSQMAQPFRIEGLWEDEVNEAGGVVIQEEMVVET